MNYFELANDYLILTYFSSLLINNSLTIFIFSTCFNLITATSLIIYENFYNNQFNSNSIIALIFILLSTTNIEILNILSSKFARLSIFSAVYSTKTQKLLFWFGILNFIIKDSPQFIIQVIIIIIS